MSGESENEVLALVARAVAGERHALDQICRLAEKWIVPVVLRFRLHDASDDAVQEAYAHLIVGLPKFDGRSKFATWVYRVAFNINTPRIVAVRLLPRMPALNIFTPAVPPLSVPM